MFRAHYPENKIRTYKNVKTQLSKAWLVFHFNEEKAEQNKNVPWYKKDNFQFHFSPRS